MVTVGESVAIETNWAMSTVTATVANAASTDDCQVAAAQTKPRAMAIDSTIQPSAVPNNWMVLIQA